MSAVPSNQDEDEELDRDAIGYGRPPKATRFTKGRSGNPRGRPRGRRSEIPYDSVLGQMVTVREDGRERRITAAEAFILQLTQKGLAGDSAAARSSLAAIEAARANRRHDADQSFVLRWVIIGMGIEETARKLGIAIKKFPLDEKRVRWEIQPWIVEAALRRLGARRLSEDEQREVRSNTRSPEKVNWPTWWTVPD